MSSRPKGNNRQVAGPEGGGETLVSSAVATPGGWWPLTGAPRRGRVLCWMVLAGSLLALASPWLVRFWIGFDLFTQLLPHMAALAVAALLCLLLPRRYGLLAGLGLLALTAAGISLYSLSHTSPGFPTRTHLPELRVMSFNLWRENERVEAVAREIRRNLPDIVAMPEFMGQMRALVPQLRDILPHHVNCLHKDKCALGLFSRWPIVRMTSASLWEGPPYLHAWVHTPWGIVHVYVVHTLRVPWIRSHYRQLRAMARIVRLQRGKPVIVMGDFNAAPYSYMLHVFEQDTALSRHTWLPSWPARPFRWPQIPIDHVFTSAHFRATATPLVGYSAGSDHLPVIVHLRWQ